MFTRTKQRLVLFNACVFFLLLVVFGSSLYAYMHHHLINDVDKKMSEIAQHLKNQSNRELLKHYSDEREADRRIVYLFWDQDRQLISQVPNHAIFTSDSELFEKELSLNQLHTLSINGHTYRLLTLNQSDLRQQNDNILAIQIVFNIDPEVNMLNHLLIIMLFGGLVAFIISIFVGYLLAERSFIPIRKSWDKQTQFVADASHELRTPLSVMQSHLEMLFRHPDHTIEDESITISRMLSEVKRMNHLIGDLLMLARSDSNQPLIELEWFDLGQLMQQVDNQFNMIAEMKELTLTIEQKEELFSFYGDRQRIHQLIIILLDNAIKYTEHGEIMVAYRKKDHHLIIEIKDTGIGISHKDLPYIFDRFYKADKARSMKEGSTGLGLSIAQWIVKAHEGTIRVLSECSSGTTFIIDLPLKQKT